MRTFRSRYKRGLIKKFYSRHFFTKRDTLKVGHPYYV